VAPERIELASGLGVEGLTPVSTGQALHGQSGTGSEERKREGRENKPRRPMVLVDETPAELSEFAGEWNADQEREPDRDQNDDGALHRIDSLA
jgi:hypothetical protein